MHLGAAKLPLFSIRPLLGLFLLISIFFTPSVGFSQPQSIPDIAQSNIDSGLPLLALRKLAEVPESERDEQTYKLAFKALESTLDGLVTKRELGGEFWPINNANFSTLLNAVEQREAGARDILVKIYEWRTLDAVASGKADVAARSFDEVIKRRLDPNAENDALRFEIALEAKSSEAKDFAMGRIYELDSAGSLSYLQKLRLLLNGYYGAVYSFLSYFCIIALACSYFITKYVPNFGTIIKRIIAQRSRSGKPGYSPGYHQLSEHDDEYSKLLKIFGLNDSATEADIKRAYRQMVKNYHPDTAVRTREEVEDIRAAEQFRELRQVYERILEIRRSWFGGR